MPVLIWRRLVGFGPSVLADVAVLSILLAGLAVAIMLLQGWLQRRVRAALIRPPQPPLRIALGRGRPLWEAGLVLFVAGTLILPLTALVATYGVPLTFKTVTFGNYAEVLLRQDAAIRAFANFTLVTSSTTLALAGLAVFVSRFAEGAPATGRRIGGAVATFAEMSYAIPGLVISIAFILVYLRPIPVVGILLYNMLTLIFLAYLTAFFAIGLKPVAAATGQLDPALDDAARGSGRGCGASTYRSSRPRRHHRDAGGQRHRLLLVAGDEDRRGAGPRVKSGDLALHRATQMRVENGERFVHQDRARPAGQTPNERNPQALPPDSSAGRRSAYSVSATIARCADASSRAARRARPKLVAGKATLSRTSICGQSA